MQVRFDLYQIFFHQHILCVHSKRKQVKYKCNQDVSKLVSKNIYTARLKTKVTRHPSVLHYNLTAEVLEM